MTRGRIKRIKLRGGKVSRRTIYDLAPDPVIGQRRQHKRGYPSKAAAGSPVAQPPISAPRVQRH
jgi:hypothetical protein